jgi:hypothetical protein
MTESIKPVATVERDESRDVGIHEDFDQMRPWSDVGDDYRWEHYVPHADLQTETARRVALDERIDIQETVEFRLRAKLEEEQAQLRKQTETLLKLRAFVELVADTAYDDNLSCKAQDLLLEISK